MNLRQLEVFHAVMATGSTIAASELLDISQSAASRQLAALEADLGFELFRRDRGRLVPTPEAQALVEEVGELTDRVARLDRKAADLRAGGGEDTLLRVAFPHSMTTTVVPRMVRRFLAARPRVVVEILPGPYDAVERMVAGRTADLGFVRLPPEDRGFAIRPLMSAGTVCVMARRHPLAERDVVEIADIVPYDVIMIGRRRSRRVEVERGLKALAPGFRCRIETHSVESACALAAEGLGVAIVPALIAGLLTAMPIETRPLRPDLQNDYGVITLAGVPVSRAAEAFIEVLTATIVESSASKPEETP